MFRSKLKASPPKKPSLVFESQSHAKKCNQVGVEAPEELFQDETVMAAIISMPNASRRAKSHPAPADFVPARIYDAANSD